MNKKAFTLIELLVVVLIIGILAAIALPQYEKAVAKSRMAEALAMLQTIREAQEVYYLANGEYSSSFDNLDISVPADRVTTWVGSDTNRPNTYMYSLPNDGTGCIAKTANSSKTPMLQVNFLHNPGDHADMLLCTGLTNGTANTIGEQLCKSMSQSSFLDTNGYMYYQIR